MQRKTKTNNNLKIGDYKMSGTQKLKRAMIGKRVVATLSRKIKRSVNGKDTEVQLYKIHPLG